MLEKSPYRRNFPVLPLPITKTPQKWPSKTIKSTMLQIQASIYLGRHLAEPPPFLTCRLWSMGRQPTRSRKSRSSILTPQPWRKNQIRATNNRKTFLTQTAMMEIQGRIWAAKQLRLPFTMRRKKTPNLPLNIIAAGKGTKFSLKVALSRTATCVQITTKWIRLVKWINYCLQRKMKSVICRGFRRLQRFFISR